MCLDLTSVTIPNSVTSIGESAFWRCDSLTSFFIPESVTSIGEGGGFPACSNLEEIIVDRNNRNFCAKDGILYESDMKTIRACPGAKTTVTIPESVTTIGISAFYGCYKLTDVKLPSGLKIIGEKAFTYCENLTSVKLPSGL